MQKRTYNYIVVTPCKNEELNIPHLIKSVVNQTIRPVLWVIVDDGSTDKTSEMVSQIEQDCNWVKGIFLEQNKEYLGTHIAHVYNKGFSFAKDYFYNKKIDWEYMAVLDADTIPEPSYFEKLIQQFENDITLGIASGNTCENTENLFDPLRNDIKNVDVINPHFWETYPFSLKEEEFRIDLPMGSARMWRRKCFEETGGGYEPINGPDGVSTVKAKIKGWQTRRFKNILLIERKGLSAMGYWYGYKDRGFTNYFLGLPSSMVIMKAINYSFKKPYYIGIAYMYGYTKCLISGKKRLQNAEVRQYYHNIHSKKSKLLFLEKINKIIKSKIIR